MKETITSNGFIKLHRELLDWEWYQDINTTRLFVHLLLKANHKDNPHQGIIIKRGQVKTGRIKLAEETGLSQQQVRTCLDKLKSTSEITSTIYRRFSIISITNWDKYQINTTTLTSTATSYQPAINHKQERKERKEDKEVYTKESIKTFWNSKLSPLGLGSLRLISNDRVRNINARVEDIGTKEEFESLLVRKISNSKFLQNKGDWKNVNFDWVINPTNFAKIVNGNFDSKKGGGIAPTMNMFNPEGE